MTTSPTINDWWKSAVVYQVYPRSFADSNGDGIGDVRGIIDHLDHLVTLGVDALWISPWYPSPMADGGYDVSDYCDINPDFGTLADADALVAQAHELGLRVIIDLVPNHSSQEHPWFKKALAAAPGSPERDRYIFRDGRGENGELPPNNWPSVFGSGAWERITEPDGTPGQWYLHFFDVSQPDWNWENSDVLEEFDRVLRFWFDRGIDGFRIDVANSLVKESGLPDLPENEKFGELVGDSPMWDQPELASIQRRWRAIADEYADTPEGPRMFVAEAYLPHDRLVRYLESDRLHTSFNFEFLISAWKANSLRTTITESLAAHESVGASATWVLGNHDNVRPVSRYGKEISGLDFSDPSAPHAQFHGTPTDVALGRCRARAAAMLELALPGGAFTKAKNLASQRSKIFPKKPSKTPPGNVLDTQIAVVTDVAFPCRGAVPTHPMGGRQTRTPGSPCRVIGPSGPSNLSRTIRHPSLPSTAPYWPSAMPTQHWAPER